ncbi:ParA family protein [Roseateles sp. MS654]|uniref:ParA family protein n=1 Tax=Roseateles sp. MS654 TaxID=3412685 RepID=UPI003C2EBF82
MKSIAFFNNKGGVGKTTLVYHLAWMYSSRGLSVLVMDLDPQANLSAMFLEDQRLAELWEDGENGTVVDSLRPLIARTGDIAPPHVEMIGKKIGLVPGNLALSRFEGLLSENWSKCLDGEEAAFRVITAFHRIMRQAAAGIHADVILIDVGPNLGAINRSALIAAEQVVLPLAPDLFSLQGLRNLGPTLLDWRRGWRKRLAEMPSQAGIDAPTGEMQPLGYVVMQHGVRESRPVKAYGRWLDRIPGVYREAVLDTPEAKAPAIEEDPHCLSMLKHYRSLMPMAMDARKPMFSLKPADGAIGAHVEAVRACHDDFLALAERIAARSGFAVS